MRRIILPQAMRVIVPPTGNLEKIGKGCVYLDGELIGYRPNGRRLVELEVMPSLAGDGMTMLAVTHEIGLCPRSRRPYRFHGRA